MDKLSKSLVTLFCIGAFLALLSTLEPWYNETFREKEIKKEEKAKQDALLCPGTEYKIINEVTYCDYQGRLVKPKDYKRLIK